MTLTKDHSNTVLAEKPKAENAAEGGGDGEEEEEEAKIAKVPLPKDGGGGKEQLEGLTVSALADLKPNVEVTVVLDVIQPPPPPPPPKPKRAILIQLKKSPSSTPIPQQNSFPTEKKCPPVEDLLGYLEQKTAKETKIESRIAAIPKAAAAATEPRIAAIPTLVLVTSEKVIVREVARGRSEEEDDEAEEGGGGDNRELGRTRANH